MLSTRSTSSTLSRSGRAITTGNASIRILALAALLMAVVALLLSLAPARAQLPQYQTDQAAVTQPLNDFWTLQGLGRPTQGIKPNWAALLGSSDWFEWNSLKLDWTDDLADKSTQRSLLLGAYVDGVNPAGTKPAGYVWPANNSRLWFGLHEHFDQMPRYICAVYNDYLWSRDLAFLQRMRPGVEADMGYMMDTMQGKNGMPLCPGVHTGLANTAPPTTYMDAYREGGQVGWIDEEYYTALEDMAALESILGDPVRAAAYTAQARQFPAQFHAAFWNPKTRRYAGWKDTEGTLHDYGFTYLNLEALARGLGSEAEAYQIFDWLDHGTAQPTVMGGHSGSTDIYQCVVAPRSNTLAIPDADWDFWSVSKSLRRSSMGYGALVEDGGAMLWVNYYDVMARLRWLDADSAWRKFTDMLYRVEGDPLRFTEYPNHPTNVYGENYLEVGPADGSEIGLSGTAPLYGFMGVQPRPDGLYCSPNLPTSLLSLTSNNIHFGSSAYNIQVARGQVIMDSASSNHAALLHSGTAQPFIARSAFNTVGVCLAGLSGFLSRVAVRLQKRSGFAWMTVASSSATIAYKNLYQYIPVPVQPAGTYQIMLTLLPDAARKSSWNGGYSCRAVYEPAAPIETGLLGRTSTDFTAKHSFSVIKVQTSAHVSLGVMLSRKMGTTWRPVEAAWTAGVRGGVLAFADQPAGSYQLRFTGACAGSYTLLSNRYTVTVTNAAVPTARAVAAGEAVRLVNGSISRAQGM